MRKRRRQKQISVLKNLLSISSARSWIVPKVTISFLLSLICLSLYDIHSTDAAATKSSSTKCKELDTGKLLV